METKFLVCPIERKRRYYSNLSDIRLEFNESELEGAAIACLYGGVIVGYLNTDSVLYEVYATV